MEVPGAEHGDLQIPQCEAVEARRPVLVTEIGPGKSALLFSKYRSRGYCSTSQPHCTETDKLPTVEF